MAKKRKKKVYTTPKKIKHKRKNVNSRDAIPGSDPDHRQEDQVGHPQVLQG